MIACLSLDVLNEEQMCYSFESQSGWTAISILIDSGASDSVAPPGTFPGVNVFETNASRSGLEYTAAGGHKIAHFVYVNQSSKHWTVINMLWDSK